MNKWQSHVFKDDVKAMFVQPSVPEIRIYLQGPDMLDSAHLASGTLLNLFHLDLLLHFHYPNNNFNCFLIF